MGLPLGAAKYNSLLQGAASLDRLGTTGLAKMAKFVYKNTCPSVENYQSQTI